MHLEFALSSVPIQGAFPRTPARPATPAKLSIVCPRREVSGNLQRAHLAPSTVQPAPTRAAPGPGESHGVTPRGQAPILIFHGEGRACAPCAPQPVDANRFRSGHGVPPAAPKAAGDLPASHPSRAGPRPGSGDETVVVRLSHLPRKPLVRLGGVVAPKHFLLWIPFQRLAHAH